MGSICKRKDFDLIDMIVNVWCFTPAAFDNIEAIGYDQQYEYRLQWSIVVSCTLRSAHYRTSVSPPWRGVNDMQIFDPTSEYKLYTDDSDVFILLASRKTCSVHSFQIIFRSLR